MTKNPSATGTTTTTGTTTLNKEELEHYILDAMDRWEVPGLSIAIVKDGKIILAKGYGTREVGKDLPVDEQTLFPIVCTTASFTAAALAILVGEGKLDWHDRLIDLLPNFKTGNDLVSNYATVIDAMANRTGLAMEHLSIFPHPDLDRADILGRMKYLPSATDFRSQWAPSFHMNLAAGEIIPALTGISWDDFIRDRLFTPIGMKDSMTRPHLLANHSNIAVPHETLGGKVTSVAHAQTANVGPAMSIYSCAADMAKWLTFQLNNGKIGDRIIIGEDEITAIRSSYIAANFDFPGISRNFINQGLGLFISDSSTGHKLYSNGGDTEGVESYHAFVPELGLGIAVMVNSTKVLPQPLVAWVIDRYTDAPRKDWVNEMVPFYTKDGEMILSKLEASRQKITDPSKKPSHPIESYAGLYRHPLLGDLAIEEAAGELSFTLGTSYKGDLPHANHDTFFIKVNTPHLGKFLFNGPVQFRRNQTGEVSSLLAMDKEFQKLSSLT